VVSEIRHTVKWRGIAWLATTLVLAHAQAPTLREAMALMERGDFQAAERSLRRDVGARPGDALALSLLGAALDNLNQSVEAAEFHRRALAIAPGSIDILNSYAAHLAMTGMDEEARKTYLQVVAIDAANRVANLQLARLALKTRDGPDSLRYLDRLPAQERESAPALLLRLQAVYLSGETAQGGALLARLSEMARTDLNLSSALVKALSNVRQYGHAEAVCESALKAWPANFNVLYGLGVVATYAGHYGRAREALEAAVGRQPRNVDALYALARANTGLRQWETAIGLLAQAGQLDPRRANVQQLLAVSATELGALDDAAAGWDRYLRLEPRDDEARRERSYIDVLRGQPAQGIAGLEWFAARHPSDATVHYELGEAERNRDPAKAFTHFDKALELDPNHAAARAARGSLYYQAGKLEAAVKDLEMAVALGPEDAAALDRLGQAYAALDRTADAVRVLRKAAGWQPDDSKILLHFGRALADAGSLEESKAVMDRFRELGSEKPHSVPAGLVEYLGLTPEQRRADYRARVEKEVREHPEDAGARLAWLKSLIEDGNWDGAAEAARALAALQPAAAVLAGAGRALLSAKQFGLALEVMEPIPEAARGGDYYLARAQALSAAGKTQETLAALDLALRSAPPQQEFYLQATALLVGIERIPEALRFLAQGARLLPESRAILLLEAAVQALAGQDGEAGRRLSDLRSRWPEWYPAWVAQGIVLTRQNRPEEARQAFETAAALGSPAALLSLDLKALVDRAPWR